MSFWNSQWIEKARKPHTCLYCGRTIQPGERYSYECGTYEDEFQHYNLCERCRYLCEKYEHDDTLGEFADTLWENDLLICPSCGSINLSGHEFSDDMMSCQCECDECGEKWTSDLTIEGLKRANNLCS